MINNIHNHTTDPLQYFSLQLGHWRVGLTPHISEGGVEIPATSSAVFQTECSWVTGVWPRAHTSVTMHYCREAPSHFSSLLPFRSLSILIPLVIAPRKSFIFWQPFSVYKPRVPPIISAFPAIVKHYIWWLWTYYNACRCHVPLNE